jgi:hypothetical protein
LSDNSETPTAESAPQAAFLFEFDHLVVGLREASFDVLKSIYDDVDLQPVHYSRFGLTEGPHKTIDQLQSGLSVRKGQPKKVSEELVSGVKMHLESGNISISDDLRNVIVQARDLGMRVVAMTALPIQPRDALAAQLDLSGLGIDLMPFGTDLEPAPRADSWLKLIKEEGIRGPASISLTTSMQAAKSSLTASIPSVVFPDRFTSFQDFGGARAVVESLKDIKLKELCDYGITVG